jgi:hypothetical protein
MPLTLREVLDLDVVRRGPPHVVASLPAGKESR